ncbi:MAG: DUF2142 domain-containing protein [Cellulomonas sp.]|uniref:DUF2142 domain-containing protein n=1 Tax=Cellulomonas sp. TaxID=40001 RepID=UPI001A0B5689|nr:DUF2142 domain-containing protein [Cellulomonas sp.]MBF0687190.1 DUF2142 domain-containing protein [Cellulomonas sp.]
MSRTAPDSAATSTRHPVRQYVDGILQVARGAVRSPWAGSAVVAGFAVQSAVLAVVLRRSIYDEDYHLGAIAYFAGGAGPFDEQPDTLRRLGDVERYGSYLYHVLLGVVWRMTAGLAPDHRVVVLRLVSVAMVAGALLVLRRLMLVLGMSGAATNVALLLVASVPMLTFLAASVNYDNLMILAVCLLWLAVAEVWRGERDPWSAWARVLLWSGVACLAKFSAVPLVAGTVMVLLVRQVLVLRRGREPRPGATRVAVITRGAWLLAAVVASVAVVERYGWNLVRYGTPLPDCIQVQDLQTCLSWGPWRRNYELDGQFPDLSPGVPELVAYVTRDWIPSLSTTWTFFGAVVDGKVSGTLGAHVAGLLVVAASVAVVVLCLVGLRDVAALRGAVPLLVGCTLYVVALGGQNFSDYLRLGEPVGVQGRYLLPVAVVLIPFAVHAWAHLVRRQRLRSAPFVTALAVALMISQGGGVIGVLARSDTTWFRPGGWEAVGTSVREVALTVVLDDALIPDPRRVVGTSAVP